MNNEDIESLLAKVDINQRGGAGNRTNTGAKKAKNGDSNKKRVAIETIYEGYTLRPISPGPGEKKSFAKVAKTALPFDSAKLYAMATKHRVKTGKDAATYYRDLSANQQAVIKRVIDEKNRDEISYDAIWEPFDIRKINTDVKKGLLLVERQLSHIELTIRRKDRDRALFVDKPTGTTISPNKVQGEIIDLSVPMQDKPKKNKKKNQGFRDDAHLDTQHGSNGYDQHADNHAQSPNDNYYWNGTFWEEIPAHGNHHTNQHDHQQQRQQPRQHEQQTWPQQQHEQQQWPQQQQQQQPQWHQQHEQQWPQVPPAAPMPTYEHNPFQPYGTHPEQYADLPPTIERRASYERPHHRSSRSNTRSRSRSRHRQRRPRHQYTASMSSSEADHYADYTPPSTPPLEEFVSAGHLHRNKSQRYYREGRRYPNERYELRPGVAYRTLDFEERARPRRERPVMIHDDFPGTRRRITDFAEGREDADFRRPRRDRGLDQLWEDPRGRRRDEAHLQRRHAGYY